MHLTSEEIVFLFFGTLLMVFPQFILTLILAYYKKMLSVMEVSKEKFIWLFRFHGLLLTLVSLYLIIKK